ncbi:hypothetical protein ACEQ8H_008159 [Pleosporales sp. CAS-2024a]
MLHEILLSLAGHPSALLDPDLTPGHPNSTVQSRLSPQEAALLSSIGRLSRLHRDTRVHAARVTASHPSTVCRAVAASITSHHLAAFQRKVLDVECRILKQDASTVGAYNIVPLACIVNEFSEWLQLMGWLWTLSTFMLPVNVVAQAGIELLNVSSGAQIIDKLRAEIHTGHPVIEEAARQLGRIAETSWLRQLSTWLLYGRLPSSGTLDFFVNRDQDQLDEWVFKVNYQLLPKFVTYQTASSILFVGRSLNQIKSVPDITRTSSAMDGVSELDLLPRHVEILSTVHAPVVAAELAEAVTRIRLSLSQNLLQHLMPRDKIVEMFNVFYQFFLLGRGEFAMVFVTEADHKVLSRHRGPLSARSNTTKGVTLKEAEISQILARSLATLTTLSGSDEHTDDTLEAAARVLQFTQSEVSSNRPGTPGRAKDSESILSSIAAVSFNELLLSMPCNLSMTVPFPLDLLVTKADLDVYSSVNSYLLAIRRAHLHLAQLWRHSSIRRDHPSAPSYEYSNSAHGKIILRNRRRRTMERTKAMRKIWATCAAAVFFLGETEAYFQGTVVRESYVHFLSWLGAAHSPISHDPEALGLAHRRYLTSIVYSLLLTDYVFTASMRQFCTHVDELVAYITRLTGIQQNMDLEEDEGIENFAENSRHEEGHVLMELDRARRRLDSNLKELVERLGHIDNERIGVSAPSINYSSLQSESIYEPLRAEGLDRLLMKLDWSSELEDYRVDSKRV